MDNKKRLIYLEIAFDLISKIHSDICNNGSKDDNTVNYTLDVLNKMSLLKNKMKGDSEQCLS